MVFMLLVNDQHRALIYPIIPTIYFDSSPCWFCVLDGITPCRESPFAFLKNNTRSTVKNRKNDMSDASLQVDHPGDVHFVPVWSSSSHQGDYHNKCIYITWIGLPGR
jgi:hypothetical protein